MLRSTRQQRSQRTGPAFGAVFTLLMIISGCGAPRSVEAFCGAVETAHGRLDRTLQERNAAYADTDDLLAQLGNAFEGFVEVQEEVLLSFREMSGAAPEEIRVDAERLAELYEEQIERSGRVESSLSALVGGLGEALLGGVRTSVHLERVDDYARDQCSRSAIPFD